MDFSKNSSAVYICLVLSLKKRTFSHYLIFLSYLSEIEKISSKMEPPSLGKYPKSTTHVMTTFTEATPIQKKASELIDVNRKKQFP